MVQLMHLRLCTYVVAAADYNGGLAALQDHRVQRPMELGYCCNTLLTHINTQAV